MLLVVQLDEPPPTASGGYFGGGEINRNKRSPQCGAAPIEIADERRVVAPVVNGSNPFLQPMEP